VIDYIKEVGEFVKIADGTQISASNARAFPIPLATSSMHPSMLSGGKTSLISVAHSDKRPHLLILDEP